MNLPSFEREGGWRMRSGSCCLPREIHEFQTGHLMGVPGPEGTGAVGMWWIPKRERAFVRMRMEKSFESDFEAARRAWMCSKATTKTGWAEPFGEKGATM